MDDHRTKILKKLMVINNSTLNKSIPSSVLSTTMLTDSSR